MFWGVGLGAVVTLASPAANAQASLGWSAPAECPPGHDVGERVSSLLGYTLDQHAERVDFEAEVSATADGTWHLLLRVIRGGKTAERRIDGETCDAVAGAAAVAIALVLKPDPMAEPEETFEEESADAAEPEDAEAALREASETPAPEPPSGSNAVSEAPQTPPPPTNPIGAGARLTAGVDVATFGETAFAADLAFGLLVGDHWRGELFGRLIPSQRVSVDRGARVDFQWLGGGVRGCAQPVTGSFGLLGCLGVEAGRIEASGQGVSRTQTARVTWLGPLGTVVGFWSLTDALALAGTAEVAAPLARHEFQIDGIGVVHRLPAVTARFAVGLEGVLK